MKSTNVRVPDRESMNNGFTRTFRVRAQDYSLPVHQTS